MGQKYRTVNFTPSMVTLSRRAPPSSSDMAKRGLVTCRFYFFLEKQKIHIAVLVNLVRAFYILELMREVNNIAPHWEYVQVGATTAPQRRWVAAAFQPVVEAGGGNDARNLFTSC